LHSKYKINENKINSINTINVFNIQLILTNKSIQF